MLNDELKAIEVLLHYITSEESMDTSIHRGFNNNLDDFNRAKGNLFNLLLINNLLRYVDKFPSFNLEQFFRYGTVGKKYSSVIKTPTFDKNNPDYREFYRNIIKALKVGYYAFDEDNNIYVVSNDVETIIPSEWLYRLSEVLKSQHFTKTYFFNKNEEINITDEHSLDNYLRHTKMFVVNMDSLYSDEETLSVYRGAVKKTTSSASLDKEVKVADLMDMMINSIPKEYNPSISKLHLPSSLLIIRKANAMGDKFYNKSLEEQKELINTWILEYMNSNELANIETQKLIANTVDSRISKKKLSKEKCLIGLFNLYMNIISCFNIDFDYMSLSSFKLKEYISPSFVNNYKELLEVIKRINMKKKAGTQSVLGEKAMKALARVNEVDGLKNPKELAKRKKIYEEALSEYEEFVLKDVKTDLERRNTLQNLIRQDKDMAITSIAFENNTIMRLIFEAVKNGRIYVKPEDRSKLVIELCDKEIGKVTFKTEISLRSLLEFIESTNLDLTESEHIKYAA